MNELTKRWDEILNIFKEESDIHSVAFSTFIKPLKISHINNNTIYLICEQDTFIPYIEKRFLDFLKYIINSTLNTNYEISLIASSSKNNADLKPSISAYSSHTNSNIKDEHNLNPNYTFEKFVIGNNNYAYAAALAVAESPTFSRFNPLFFYGSTGLGKTHLMQAIAHHIIKNNPSLKVLYVTSETFTNEIVDSIQKNRTVSFREKYRNIDVFLIDDIQFVIGKERSQEEFFNTFNDLYQHNKQIVITSDTPPKELGTLNERLTTRFIEGLICDIHIPTYETKMAILNQKLDDLEEHGSYSNLKDIIPEDVRNYVASNIKSSVRELEGAINKLISYAEFYPNKTPISIDSAREALKDIINAEKQITTSMIYDIVAGHFDITVENLKSVSRASYIAYPRQIAMYLCRHMIPDVSTDKIGNELNKDHSTVVYGSNKIASDLLTDNDLKETIELLMKKINPAL